MSGGIAYVWDKDGDFASKCNTETFDLDAVEDEADIAQLQSMIEKHFKYTGSTVAESILCDWDAELGRFVKVMPKDYKRVLMEMAREEKATAIA